MSNELDPRLKKKLESLQEVPDRRLQQSLAGRDDFLAFAKTLKPYQPPVKQQRTKPGRRKSWVPRLIGILAALALAFFSIGGTVYAAQASLPDDLLYLVKILTEDIQIGLETDPEDRLDLHVSFASRRLQEIQAQVEAGEEVSEQALALLEKHTQKMLQEAAQMGENGLNNALRQIEENLQKQNQMMEMLQKEHPHGGAPGLVRAQEKIRSRLELVENGIKEPKGFKENVHQGKPDNSDQGNKNKNDNPNKPETPPGLIDKDKKEKNPGQGKGNNNPGAAPTEASTNGHQGTD